MNNLYKLKTSYRNWSAGTVVIARSPTDELRAEWKKSNTVDHGYTSVETRSPQADGKTRKFDIEADLLIPYTPKGEKLATRSA